MRSPLNSLKAWALDTLLWSISFLIAQKVLYEKMILRESFPEFSWFPPMICLALGAGVSGLLFFTSASVGKMATKQVPPRKALIPGLLHLILALVAGISLTETSLREFFSPHGLSGARRIFGALLTPNFSILETAITEATETIAMAFMATVWAIPPAFILSFLAARNVMKRTPALLAVYSFTRTLMNLTRSIEPLIWAIIFSVWVGIGPFAGTLALCLHSISSLTKLYSEQIESTLEGPIEAIVSTGGHPIQVLWYGVVPQVILPFLSFTIYRWDINVRMAI